MFRYIILALAVGTACAAPASQVANQPELIDKPAPLANLKPELPLSPTPTPAPAPAPAPALSTEPSPPAQALPLAPVSESPIPIAQPSDSRLAKSLYSIPIMEPSVSGYKLTPVILPLPESSLLRQVYLVKPKLPFLLPPPEYTVEQYGYHITH